MTAVPCLKSALAQGVSTAPVSTSQCVEGPGAPPADPTKVTRVNATSSSSPTTPTSAAAPGAQEEVREEAAIDAPKAPGAAAPALFELGAFVGLSMRFDEPPVLTMTRQVGPTLGASAFVWTSQMLAFGLVYTHVDLSRSETTGIASQFYGVDYRANVFLAGARVSPFRWPKVALFAEIDGGVAWQSATLRGTVVGVDGMPSTALRCDAGSNAELAFRGAIGMKARVSHAAAVVIDAGFMGYRFSSDVQGGCAPGAGTAQTLLIRAGLTYDVDVTRFVR
ncbi:MAG: hypothetical protein IPK82_18720 [Polyangiaceae bacterium]|nr:hypothetical protein [Polyangiaceae bacterium]